MIRTFVVMIVLLVAVQASAQVLTTADTLGAGKNALMGSENALVMDGTQINIAYAMYVRGLTSSADLYLAAGETHLLGQRQAWLGIGGNVHLGKIAGNSISLFGVVSLPLTGRQVGSSVLINQALMVSRPLTDKVSLYSGINVLIPVGASTTRFFTPPETQANVPVGVSVTLGNWGLTAEADFGKLKALGVALSRTF